MKDSQKIRPESGEDIHTITHLTGISEDLLQVAMFYEDIENISSDQKG